MTRTATLGSGWACARLKLTPRRRLLLLAVGEASATGCLARWRGNQHVVVVLVETCRRAVWLVVLGHFRHLRIDHLLLVGLVLGVVALHAKRVVTILQVLRLQEHARVRIRRCI